MNIANVIKSNLITTQYGSTECENVRSHKKENSDKEQFSAFLGVWFFKAFKSFAPLFFLKAMRSLSPFTGDHPKQQDDYGADLAHMRSRFSTDSAGISLPIEALCSPTSLEALPL